MNDPTIITLAQFLDPLETALAGLGIHPTIRTVSGEEAPEIADLLPDADVLLSGVFRGEWLAGRPPLRRLRLIQALGAGYDGIDLEAVPAGVTVCNVYGHEYGIAEHVFMVMTALNRDLIGADQRLRSGEWGTSTPVRELRGRTLCIVGLGRIGRELARWGAFYGMRVTAVNRTRIGIDPAEFGLAAFGGLDDLPRQAAAADFVVNALPHTPDTLGLIGREVIAAMRPTAYLVNVGRGPVVDEMALFEALRDGQLAGAAIDVWYRYPETSERILPSTAPFHELKNIIVTPHQAGFTEGTMRHRWSAIAENIRRAMAGEQLENVVWPRPS